jgi:kinesin family protein 5
LVEQNSTLKKEVAIAERKLSARNERIQSLEQLLHEAQDHLASQNHKFEQQLQLVRERLEQARVTRAANPPTAGITGVTGGFLQGRIAKPLRGGGAVDNVNGMSPGKGYVLWRKLIYRPLAAVQENGQSSKRASWFFDRR